MSLTAEVTLLGGKKTTVHTGLYINGQWRKGSAEDILYGV
jgi:hypothetical protein